MFKCSYSESITNPYVTLQGRGSVHYVPYSQFIPLLHYSESQCQNQKQIHDMFSAFVIVGYVALFVSVLTCKIVGLELFGVFQLAYFSLVEYDFLVLYLQPIGNIKGFNGFNIQFVEDHALLPESFAFIHFKGYFVNNFNVMFLLMVVVGVIGLLLYSLGRIRSKGTIEEIGLRLLKQGSITLLIFNIFNMCFSMGTHFKFA